MEAGGLLVNNNKKKKKEKRRGKNKNKKMEEEKGEIVGGQGDGLEAGGRGPTSPQSLFQPLLPTTPTPSCDHSAQFTLKFTFTFT